MKLILTPRRHAVALKPGERHKTPEEKSAEIAEGRRRMVLEIKKRFRNVLVLGIEGEQEILIEIPDGDPGLKDRIRAELDVEFGPVPGDGPPMPVWRTDLPPTIETIDAMFRERLYRPTVVAIIRDDEGRFLLVQAERNDEWGVVQGGIEEREPPLVALFREIKEEIGVGARRVRRTPPKFVGCADIDAEPGTAEHLRFTRGVRYFVYDVAYRGPATLRLKSDELKDYDWVGPRFDDARLLSRLSRTRPSKQSLMIGSFIRVLD